MNGGEEGRELPFEWVVRLWEKEPPKLYGILAAACLAGLAGWFLFRSPFMALLGFAVICAGTTDFWLPIRYRLDEQGASLKCGVSTTAIDWENVRRVVVSEVGVKLSPLEQEGRMSPFRGVFLRFAANRSEVLDRIRSKVGESCSISGETS
ncbi:MAG: hypothetical protein U0S12_06020 [Fimbriimonadales bacterium]